MLLLRVACTTDWAGRSEGVPRVEKYDIKPYEPEDDDEYRTPAEVAASEPHNRPSAPVAGGVSSILSQRICLHTDLIKSKQHRLDSPQAAFVGYACSVGCLLC